MRIPLLFFSQWNTGSSLHFIPLIEMLLFAGCMPHTLLKYICGHITLSSQPWNKWSEWSMMSPIWHSLVAIIYGLQNITPTFMKSVTYWYLYGMKPQISFGQRITPFEQVSHELFVLPIYTDLPTSVHERYWLQICLPAILHAVTMLSPLNTYAYHRS